MNSAHDLGGQMDFGPVQPEPDEPVFHGEWEKRVLAINVAAGAMGAWTIDEIRHARESLPPAQYLSASYYEIWLAALDKVLARHGFVSGEELERGEALIPRKEPKRVLKGEEVPAVLRRGFPYERGAQGPARFAVGDRVRTVVMHPQHHTRLPRYGPREERNGGAYRRPPCLPGHRRSWRAGASAMALHRGLPRSGIVGPRRRSGQQRQHRSLGELS